MNEQDTIMDIIRKIRAEADSIEESARGSLKAGETWDGRPFTESDLEAALDLAERKRKEADRLEAAYKREMSKNTSKNGANFGQLGNAAKLREAVLALKELDFNKEEDCYDFYRIIDAALAEPPRNCDVGTAEEQLKRLHNTICNTTKACPDPDWSCAKCFAVWSQTPYEEGGAK